MKTCLVIGGGFAGLSAAVYLSEKGVKVKLIEASPKLGGRAYSLLNHNCNDSYDNGQHILMGCYEETITFLKKINASDNLHFPKSLEAIFITPGGKIHKLSASKYFYPFNLLISLLRFTAVNFKSRLRIIDFFLDLLCCCEDDLTDMSVAEWLLIKKQTNESIKAFWQVLCVGALNTAIDKASAKVFAEILKGIFFNGTKSAAILLAKVGLTDLYVNSSHDFIMKKGGEAVLSERVVSFESSHNRIIKIITDKNSYSDFDFVITAIPAYALKKIIPKAEDEYFLPNFSYSSIINIHLWLKENPFTEKFYGLIDSKIHWLFNFAKHISLTISDGNKFIGMDNKELLSNIYSELEIYFPIFPKELVVDSKIIKEKRATFISDSSSNIEREKIKLPFENLFLAGDWVKTGLPSTIESAVLSGRLVAEKIFCLMSI